MKPQMTVLFFEEAGKWVAQCLEHDLCTSADSLAALPAAFGEAIAGHVAIAVAEGLAPLVSLPEAPERYWRALDSRLAEHGRAVRPDYRQVLADLRRQRDAADAACRALEPMVQWLSERPEVVAAIRERRGEGEAPVPSRDSAPATCTGIAAVWCPIHGDCTCPAASESGDRTLDSSDCPLHSVDSDHAERAEDAGVAIPEPQP